jgi:putative intracellular protease/amidase
MEWCEEEPHRAEGLHGHFPRNAGGNWVDREVVRHGNLVTSRQPDDLPDFNRESIALFAEGVQRRAA